MTGEWGKLALAMLLAILLASPLHAQLGLIDDAVRSIIKTERAISAADKAADAERLASMTSKAAAATRLTHIGGAAAPVMLRFSATEAFLLDASGAATRLKGTVNQLGRFQFAPASLELLRRETLVIEEFNLPNLDLDDLLDYDDFVPGKVMLMDKPGTMRKVRVFGTGSQRIIAIEERPGLFLEFGGSGLEDARWITRRPLARHDMRVISLFDRLDSETRHSLGLSLGELHSPFFDSAEHLIELIAQQGQGTVVIVGHIEDAAFVVRNPAGRIVRSYGLDELNEASRKADGQILFLGCGAALAQPVSGFMGCVRANAVADALGDAIRQSTTGDFFSAIAEKAGDLLIRPSFAASRRAAFVLEQADNAKGAGLKDAPLFASGGGGVISADRSAELAMRVIPGISAYFQFFVIIGLIPMLLAPRSTWKKWKDGWWDAPDRQRHALRHAGVASGRLAAYLTLGPLIKAYQLTVYVLPWFAVAWLCLGAPLAVFSTVFLWFAINPEPEPEPLPEGEEAPIVSSGAGLVALVFGGGFALLWQVFQPLPEPWHFFSSQLATAFSISSVVIPGAATYLLSKLLERQGIERRRLKECLIALPMMLVERAASLFGIARTGQWDKTRNPA